MDNIPMTSDPANAREPTDIEISFSESCADRPLKALELPEPGQLGDLEIAAGDVWPSRSTPTSQALVPAIVVDQVHGQMAR